RVKQLGACDGKKQKREPAVGQELKTFSGKPHGIGQADDDLVFGSDQRQGAENRIAEPVRVLLNRITQRSVFNAATKVVDDVSFFSGDDETDSRHAGCKHALDQVLADGAGTFGFPVLSCADREQLLGKREWLNSRAQPGSRNDPPATHHAAASSARSSS